MWAVWPHDAQFLRVLRLRQDPAQVSQTVTVQGVKKLLATMNMVSQIKIYECINTFAIVTKSSRILGPLACSWVGCELKESLGSLV